MENENNKYKYITKENYSKINKAKVLKEKELKFSQQNSISFQVNVDYYEYYDEYYEEQRGLYYLIIPKEYLDNVENLRKDKNDIFTRGKILKFSGGNEFYFDAIVETTEEDPEDNNIVYCYFVPIKDEYIGTQKILGQFEVEERNGDLTYQRMEDAIKEFIGGNCCSKDLENYILGNPVINGYREFKNIFNYKRYYLNSINNFAEFTRHQEKKINNIFYQQMSTIIIKHNANRIICLIVYAIYQCRKNIKDKILICSSSNAVADSISLDLLNMKEHINKLNILRLYAKNQEKIERNKRLNKISFHLLMNKRYRRKFHDRREKKRWIVKKNDIIISTCVNSYNDDLINFKFPFVIIIDANNSSENENLIPITLNAKHVLLISYDGSDNGEINLYKRMKKLYQQNHMEI